MITTTELDFLRESNNIEDEWSDLSLQDSILAWEYIKDMAFLDTFCIKEMHKILMRSRDTITDEWKGVYRKQDIMIGRDIRGYTYIARKMGRWMTKVNELVKLSTGDGYEDLIKQDHIMYEYIHPFLDGNGRSGRILMNWERLQLGLPILIIKEKEKHRYYEWFR